MSTAKYLGSTMGDKNDVKIALLEQANDYFHETLQRIEKKIDSLDRKHESSFQKLENKVDSHFKWTIGTIIGSVLIPVLLKIFHLM